MRHLLLAILAFSALSACSSDRDLRSTAVPGTASLGSGDIFASDRPRIIAPAEPLQCVPFARAHSAFTIRGDAWTWWDQADGKHLRDKTPVVGSILVLKRSQRLEYGHIAVVSRIVSKREIRVDHANWLNRGQIHKDAPVIDVSERNDWSAVRFWYIPGNVLGRRTYAAHGFIHPHQSRSLAYRRPFMRGPDVRLLQEALIREGFSLSPDGVYGSETKDAILVYQQRKGLWPNGVAGPETREHLGL